MLWSRKTFARIFYPGIDAAIDALLPGFEEIQRDSEFYTRYIKDKRLPYGMSAISVGHEKDIIVPLASSRLDTKIPNNHNLEVNMSVRRDELKPLTTANMLIHLKTSLCPEVVIQAFQQKILDNPIFARNLLDNSNYDGLRYACLEVLLEHEKENPGYLAKPRLKPLVEKIREVADEKIPFTNAPSYMAKGLLQTAKIC